MTTRFSILLTAAPGLAEGVTAHHEATSGMGALTPGRWTAAGTDRPFIYPPQTLASCTGAAVAAGLDATLLDLLAAPQPLSALLTQIVASSADVVALLVSHGTAHADETFLRLLRQARPKRGCGAGSAHPILVFGPSAHLVAEPWLAEGLADAALYGEPEAALVEAAARLAAGELSGAIRGQALDPDAYDSEGRLTDLDRLSFPAWERAPWRPYGAVSILSSRGCPAGCVYCAYTVPQGRRFRSQSPQRTVAELAWLAEAVAPPHIQVRDPVFAHDRSRVMAICDEIARRGLRLSFACESRPEHFDDGLLRVLAAAGCTTVKIGLESGDPALLQGLRRAAGPVDAEQAIAATLRVAATCRKLGIVCQVYVMAGLPGQDSTSLERTREILRRLPSETRVHAKAYQAHPNTGLAGPSAVASAGALEELAAANRSANPWQRAARFLERRTVGARHLHSPQRGDNGPGVVSSVPSAPPHGVESVAKPLPLNMAGHRVFLTGGNGFVGGHVARALASTGAEVVALVRPDSAAAALDDLPVRIVRGDLRQPSHWLSALPGCDLCFHVAALYGGGEQADAMIASNVSGTSALLAACAAAGIRRVVHTSTIGTVGRPADPRALPDEETPFNQWEQASHYVRSKYLGELIARCWGAVGVEVIIVKPTAPVGAGDRRPTATGRRILAALAGEAIPYPPGGINHVPVQDVALGHLLAAQMGLPGQTYILGHREGNLSHAAFLQLVWGHLPGTSTSASPGTSKAGGPLPAALTANPARAITELGMPQSDLKAAFAEAVAWFLKR